MHQDLISELLASIPASLREESGTAFETGIEAWRGTRPLYLLGYNPGGKAGPDTIYGNAVDLFTKLEPNWSNYLHGRWPKNDKGDYYGPGEARMQVRVAHLLDKVSKLVDGPVPASNIIYSRSRRAGHLAAADARRWREDCWLFHAEMIRRLDVRVVVCFGGKAAAFVTRKLGTTPSDDPDHVFSETYVDRSYTSRIHKGPGPWVVQLTHPSTAAWTNADADPTHLVVQALEATARQTDV
jgi:hypothetical protein